MAPSNVNASLFTPENDESQVPVPAVRISHFLTVVYFNKYKNRQITLWAFVGKRNCRIDLETRH